MVRVEEGEDFVRYRLGELVIVSLRDGYVDMPPSRLRQVGDLAFADDLPEPVALVGGRLRLSVNAFLVSDDDGRHVLIDTGAGTAWDPTMGRLHGALAQAGVAKEAIGTVAFTHTHVDHVSGLLASDGSDAFPCLQRIFVPQAEMQLFASRKALSRFQPRCVPFRSGDRIGPGIVALAAAGHEVGHTAFEVASGGESMLIWGDTVHVPSIQFARPDLAWELDADQEQARVSRMKLLARGSRPGVSVAGAHLDFPGVGSVADVGDAFVFSAA